MVAVIPLCLLVFVAEWLLARASTPLALVFSMGVLYLTVGFRKFSNLFTDINSLLKFDDVIRAREKLRAWRNEDCAELDSGEIARLAIEHGLISSHRNVFGPVVFFLLLGPGGALLYALAVLVREQWIARVTPDTGLSDEFVLFARRAFEVIDWLPARLTAATFAVVGNFQDAVDCWRTQGPSWPDRSQGIILASGAGALGVKLGGALHEAGSERYRPELGIGEDADADYLQSAVGLIWRALVMWMLLIGLVTIAHKLG